MRYQIRKAKIDDSQALASVLTKSWKAAYKDIIPQDELMKQTDFNNKLQMFQKMLMTSERFIYIAFDGDLPCGQFTFCSSRDDDLSDYAEIVSIYALEEYWHKGLGYEMMSFVLQEISKAGYSKVFLWVFEKNQRARNFYGKFGFKHDRNTKETFFSNKPIEMRYILENIKLE